ncbi:MAG: minichromosome maintenance protein MCM [Euryarchaeota archaeon]|nr:minichromosome maintenance protein MCM [Euryarchaeota archaeon]
MEAGAQDLEVGDTSAKFEKFFRTYYSREILRVAHGYPEEKSLVVNFEDLDKYDITLAEELVRSPDAAILAAEKALKNIDLPVDTPVNIHVRFENLPATYKLLIRDIRSEDVGKFLAVEGIVRKSTDVRPKLVIGAFECERCGSVMHISQDRNKLKEPFLCESCERRGPFKLSVQESTFVDAQKILIQESLEDLRGGEHQKQLTIFFEDDLTGKITPGDRIEIVGVLRAARKRFKEKQSRVFEIFLEANSVKYVELDFEEVEVTKEDEKKITELSKDPLVYEKIRDSIAPHIYGYSDIKEAIMYQLFSSPALELPDGGRIRGDSHIIIMGEPATGKSEILQYVAKELAPRGVYASGKGTSAAGLTAAAIKDEFGDGGWTLEAGALVLADKGIACIDEFDKMETDDRGAMHEAMEQQSVSIAKAGMLATFRARCSILAAANPKYGRFDEYRAISEQVNLPPTILSRFDLIFFVRDIVEETREVAKHILDTVVSPTSITPKIEPELLRKYIAYARQNILPVLAEDARNRIEQFYVEMREVARETEDIPIPMTARQLWAIIRIARAASRVRLGNETTVEDVERAIRLVKVSLKQAGVDMETGRVDIDKIMVGVTKSQRDRLTHVLDIIKELEKEYGTAKKSEIIERAVQEGIPEREAEKAIEKLRLDGHIYDPMRDERYKVV